MTENCSPAKGPQRALRHAAGRERVEVAVRADRTLSRRERAPLVLEQLVELGLRRHPRKRVPPERTTPSRAPSCARSWRRRPTGRRCWYVRCPRELGSAAGPRSEPPRSRQPSPAAQRAPTRRRSCLQRPRSWLSSPPPTLIPTIGRRSPTSRGKASASGSAGPLGIAFPCARLGARSLPPRRRARDFRLRLRRALRDHPALHPPAGPQAPEGCRPASTRGEIGLYATPDVPTSLRGSAWQVQRCISSRRLLSFPRASC